MAIVHLLGPLCCLMQPHHPLPLSCRAHPALPSARADPFAFHLMKCLIKCFRIPGDEWGAECHEPDKVQIPPTAKGRTIVHLKMSDNWWRLEGDTQEVPLPPFKDNLRLVIAAKVPRVLPADPHQLYSSFRSGLSSVPLRTCLVCMSGRAGQRTSWPSWRLVLSAIKPAI